MSRRAQRKRMLSPRPDQVLQLVRSRASASERSDAESRRQFERPRRDPRRTAVLCSPLSSRREAASQRRLLEGGRYLGTRQIARLCLTYIGGHAAPRLPLSCSPSPRWPPHPPQAVTLFRVPLLGCTP